MMETTEIDYVVIDNVKYGIVNEIKEDDVTYVFLTAIDDEHNQMVRKYKSGNENLFLPLDSVEEVKHALELLKK